MDPKEREEKYQENLQGRVLAEYVRISNLPIRMKAEFSLMINRIIDIVGYREHLHEDPYPLTWPELAE
ncbi:unnamed protein product [Cylicocyclus nassatus]|uniref:Uncharacterized protein n=1 Tax=Cylicocyclus nassatus TaxID=53992 RepID=A0AA36HAL3_CYLNA|nr:unnamed protein product [Cylicocyclus nassatus]